MFNLSKKLYYVFFIVFLVIFSLLFVFCKPDIQTNDVEESFCEIKNYDKEYYDDTSSATGQSAIYEFTLDRVEGDYCTLVFYSLHQKVRVLCDGKLIYSLDNDASPFFDKSPGYIWNSISIPDEEEGKQICIITSSLYKDVDSSLPYIYFGKKMDIIKFLVFKYVPTMLVSIAAFLIGIFYVLFNIRYLRTRTGNSSLLMLGLFSIQLGLWKFSDLEIIGILTNNNPAFFKLPFMGLMLMCIPFILFIKDFYVNKDSIIWKICLGYSVLTMTVSIVLDGMGIMDFRQTLPLTHVLIVAVIIICVIMALIERKKYGWSDRFRVSIRCFILSFIGVCFDMFSYYFSESRHSTILGMLMFLNYVLLLGAFSLKDAKELIQKGREALKYEELAYHDALTGMLNRTAYDEFIKNDENKKDGLIAIMMDINNLKNCNDRYGHANGDRYICACAGRIEAQFGSIGNCYRIGGDEFCVLITKTDIAECEKRLERLRCEVEECKDVKDFNMSIACGMRCFDAEEDYDISDTVRRADRMMYKMKLSMKQAAAK